MELKDIVNEIRGYPGITRKRPIGRVARRFKNWMSVSLLRLLPVSVKMLQR